MIQKSLSLTLIRRVRNVVAQISKSQNYFCKMARFLNRFRAGFVCDNLDSGFRSGICVLVCYGHIRIHSFTFLISKGIGIDAWRPLKFCAETRQYCESNKEHQLLFVSEAP